MPNEKKPLKWGYTLLKYCDIILKYMFKKIKNFFAAIFIYIGVKAMGFFYKKEIKAFEEKLDLIKETNLNKIKKEAVEEAKNLTGEQKVLLDEYARMQNEILKVFVLFMKEIQKADGPEMDGLGGIWQTTTLGLNKTLQLAFSHKEDAQIKKHLQMLEKELQLAIDTNQEILGTKVNGGNGGFGYSGPMGEA